MKRLKKLITKILVGIEDKRVDRAMEGFDQNDPNSRLYYHYYLDDDSWMRIHDKAYVSSQEHGNDAFYFYTTYYFLILTKKMSLFFKKLFT